MKISKYIYSNKVASKRPQETLQINELMGVDYSSSMQNIADYHAYDMKNLLKKNVPLQKRSGYEQVGKHRINGVWECYFQGEKITIVHQGNSLFYVKDIDTYDISSINYTLIVNDETKSFIKDQKSFGVYTNDRLYLLCGTYYVLKFSKVEKDGYKLINGIYFKGAKVSQDEDTYIPTTTIGITSSNNNNGTIKRETLDAPNMLTPYRYNSINTNDGKLYDYYILDSKIYLSKETKMYGEISFTDDKANKTKSLKLVWNQTILDDYYWANVAGESIDGYWVFVDEKANEETLKIDDVWFEVISNKNNTLIKIFKETLNPNPSTDNFKIKFPSEIDESHLIDNCTFGIMYGAGGNRNRLFVSGNPNQPNVDYHTSRRNVYSSDKDMDLLDSQDLTYFSAYDYCAYGTSNTAVSDYQIMGDGSLLVLKEKSNSEPNVYFRSGQFVTSDKQVGNEVVTITDETYPLRVGNIGEGTIRGFKGTLRNLNNDITFVSKNGVFGISSTISASTLASDYKYAYARSNLINSKLCDELVECKSIATCLFDNKYFVTIKAKDDSYKTYVGDGRYAYKQESNVDNEYEYEWFVLDGINADNYYVINDSIYYTNENGLYKFDLNKEYWKDIDRIPIESGDIEGEEGKSTLEINEEILTHINEDTTFYTSNNVYTTFIKDIDFTLNESSKTIKVLTNRLKNFIDDESNKFFASYVVNIGLTITPIEDSEDYSVSETQINEFYALIKNKPLKIRENSQNGFDLYDQYDELVTLTGTGISSLLGYFEIKKNVECKYLTKAFNCGQSLYSKNLRSITIVNDSDKFSYVDFGIITKEVQKRFSESVMGGTKGLVDTYENIFKADLTNHTFSTSFTKNYLLKFNFIQFELYNENDTNCLVNNLTMVYTYGFKKNGVS